MREYRPSKGETEHYTSLADLGEAFGCKKILKQTKDKNKLAKQRDNFCNKHLCRSCHKPMQYFEGTNSMVCTNENCLGIKHEYTNSEGEKKIFYTPSYDLLDGRGSEIATNIFTEV